MEETDEKLKELTMKDIQKIKDSREMGRTYMWLEEMMEKERKEAREEALGAVRKHILTVLNRSTGRSYETYRKLYFLKKT